MGFNERLKEARLAAGLTGEKLGEAVGCSKQNISHWEAGRFEPNLGFLTKLCEVLEVPADWLLLGKVPENLSVAALREARYYETLSPEARRKWETAKMLFREPATDSRVEEFIPPPPPDPLHSDFGELEATKATPYKGKQIDPWHPAGKKPGKARKDG